MAGIETIITLFLLIGLGYIGRRTVLAGQPLAAVNTFVFYFAVPALLFSSAYKLPLESLFQPYYLGAFLVAAVLTAVVTVVGSSVFFASRDKEVMVIRALNGTFANYAYMGIPLIAGLLGDAAYGAMISIILAGNLFLIGGAQLLIESLRKESGGLKTYWSILDKSLLRNPIFLSTTLGVTASALAIQLPDTVNTALALLSPAAVPVALFCLGASLEFRAIKDSKIELLWLITVKLIIHPLLTLAVFSLAGIEDRNWLLAAVMLTALPTGALAHVVATRYQVCEKETSLSVVLSTLISVVTVSIWAALLI